ncbi:MAG: hypothetical protein JWM26_3095 [Betaproteobacteria bacterium]|nr:hypothetical protein [Betaproteobacteria bacterium]
MLARYDLEHELGSRARRTVYCGRDKSTGRKVAIELVTDDTPPDACGEAGALAHSPLDHPDVAAVYGSTKIGLLRDCVTASSAA